MSVFRLWESAWREVNEEAIADPEHKIEITVGLCVRDFRKTRSIKECCRRALLRDCVGRVGHRIIIKIVHELIIQNVLDMVIFSVGVVDLVVKATEFLASLPENWYKANSEIESFKVNLKILKEKATQWESQLKQHGLSEPPAFGELLAEAVRLLNREEDEYERHKNDPFWRWRQRLFPSKLTYLLSNLQQIVGAGHQNLASSVENSELLAKRFLTEPLPLPFGKDPKYVPLQTTVDEVRSVLEDTGGSQVVTLYGEPGMGKSSLAKHVALLYQDSISGPTRSMFDGVQYIYCGRGCRANIHQLRRAIFSNLGLGAITDANDERQGEDKNSPSFYQSALRRLLRDRRILIVLDDVWSEDDVVLTNLICREVPSRYLITSQTSYVWQDARPIKIPKPTYTQALRILNCHIPGSQTDGHPSVLPKSMEWDIRKLIWKLECHPLSLVNVAVSMNGSRAKDPTLWKSRAQHIFSFLDANKYSSGILVNERPYSQSVSASMMMMVESLPTAERNLLFLIAMLRHEFGRGVSQGLVRFLFRRLYHGNSSQSTFKYFSALEYLEDNSLVEVKRSDPESAEDSAYIDSENSACIDSERLTIHSLRREYIRQRHSPELRRIPSALTAGHGGLNEGRLLDVQDSDQCLAVVLGIAYLDESVTVEFAVPFQSVMTLVNYGEVPRSLQEQVDARELVKSARKQSFDFRRTLEKIFPLLNLEGEEDWKQQAHAHASKMVKELVCNGWMDDESMPSLLAISQVRAASFEILYAICSDCKQYRQYLIHSCYYEEWKSLSDTPCATWKALLSTWKALLSIFGSYRTLPSNREILILPDIIIWMLEFESPRTLATELQKLHDFATQSRDPGWQDLLDHVFLELHESQLTCGLLNGLDLQQYLPAIIWKVIHYYDHVESSIPRPGKSRIFTDAMKYVYRDKDYANILLTFPVPLEEWLTNISCFRQLLRLEQRFGPDSLLSLLSATPEFKAKAAEILKREWWEEDFTLWPESHCAGAVRFWGNVALLGNLHDTTKLRLVKIVERWMAEPPTYDSAVLCSCTCFDSNECCTCHDENDEDFPVRSREISRTVTIISHLHSNALVIPSLECLQQRWVTSRCSICKENAWVSFAQAFKGRALAYCQMEMPAQALSFVDLAQPSVDAVFALKGKLFSRSSRWTGFVYTEYRPSWFRLESRALIIFMKTLSKDYQGAMDILNQNQDENLSNRWEMNDTFLQYRLMNDDFLQFRLSTDRAVLFRLSGELSKAIHNFNISLEIWEKMTSRRLYVKLDPRVNNLFKYCVLQHRGYAKFLKGDLEGSQLDMKSAEDIRSRKQILEPISWDCLTDWDLGFDRWGSEEAGLNFSLLQLPVDNHFHLSQCST